MLSCKVYLLNWWFYRLKEFYVLEQVEQDEEFLVETPRILD